MVEISGGVELPIGIGEIWLAWIVDKYYLLWSDGHIIPFDVSAWNKFKRRASTIKVCLKSQEATQW